MVDAKRTGRLGVEPTDRSRLNRVTKADICAPENGDNKPRSSSFQKCLCKSQCISRRISRAILRGRTPKTVIEQAPTRFNTRIKFGYSVARRPNSYTASSMGSAIFIRLQCA